jgi:hypothetical protein
VPQSYVEAAKWYGLAAKRGDEAAGSILEKIRSVQARESARSPSLEARSASFQTAPAARQSSMRIEPTMFRFSSPVVEQRTISIGSPPSAGFHMMAGHMMGGGHFGRR